MPKNCRDITAAVSASMGKPGGPSLMYAADALSAYEQLSAAPKAA